MTVVELSEEDSAEWQRLSRTSLWKHLETVLSAEDLEKASQFVSVEVMN